ncbi:hypothetical protein TUM19329_20100 [Legionella antarctica]|uniref:Uncharacterized protein n=1 Tax=Legionella antarctica TaxID=2708020 RepID=A0A6F8T5C4_9GAMM|nr:hypothetical protein TUM19329_20100 [Legionella antarctica]
MILSSAGIVGKINSSIFVIVVKTNFFIINNTINSIIDQMGDYFWGGSMVF